MNWFLVGSGSVLVKRSAWRLASLCVPTRWCREPRVAGPPHHAWHPCHVPSNRPQMHAERMDMAMRSYAGHARSYRDDPRQA